MCPVDLDSDSPHNAGLRNSAEIPMVPGPVPLSTFRGKPLTFGAAEDIFVGNLADGREPFSWRVAAGKNPGVRSSALDLTALSLKHWR